MSYWWWQESFTRQHLFNVQRTFTARLALCHLLVKYYLHLTLSVSVRQICSHFTWEKGNSVLGRLKRPPQLQVPGRSSGPAAFSVRTLSPSVFCMIAPLTAPQQPLSRRGQSIAPATTSLSANNRLNSLPVYVSYLFFYIFKHKAKQRLNINESRVPFSWVWQSATFANPIPPACTPHFRECILKQISA